MNLLQRFFPKQRVKVRPTKNWDDLSADERQALALETLTKGELALIQGDLSAINSFEMASQIDPSNPIVLYRQGLAFFDYGSQPGNEKSLLLASKQLKIAVQLNPHFFEAWVAWGNTLLQLGHFHEEQHYFLEAREKYEKALRSCPGITSQSETARKFPGIDDPRGFGTVSDAEVIPGRALKSPGEKENEVLGELYWDYAVAWMMISRFSGEALDLHLALQNFDNALKYQTNPLPEFWHDRATTFLELGLLLNDQGHLIQATETFQKAVAERPSFIEGWLSLATTYSQLYLNSMDERFALKASASYAKAISLEAHNGEALLGWGQLLAETGKLNRNEKALEASVEKCKIAASLDPEDIAVIAQLVESLASLGALTGKLELLTEAEQKITLAVDQFSGEPDLWHAYGLCIMGFARYFEDEEHDYSAIEKLQHGLSIDRTNAEIWHALALAHKHAADLTDEEVMIERAARFFAKAMDLKPHCPSLTYDTASAFLHYSETFDDLSALEYAIALFESLFQTHQLVLLHHPEWLFEYASAIEWLGDYTGEEKDFLRSIDLFSHVLLINPDHPNTHFRMAENYAQLGHLTGESESYKKAIHSFRLASRQDEENPLIWLSWSLSLIHLANRTIEPRLKEQLYLDAEQKIFRAGRLGHPTSYYHLASLYSLLGRTPEAMALIQKGLATRSLPPLEDMLADEWLEPLRSTSEFTEFMNALEAKLEAREQ
jgi:tetratricopeptide (TPR) repeat protein